jgi:hypothetical protein
MPSNIFSLLLNAACNSPDTPIIFDSLETLQSAKKLSYLELVKKVKVCTFVARPSEKLCA